jgi:hypothetical protein
MLGFLGGSHDRIRVSGRIVPVVLDLGTKWRWMVSFTPQPLYSREKTTGTHRVVG